MASSPPAQILQFTKYELNEPGFLKTLTEEQEIKLQQLWGLFILYLAMLYTGHKLTSAERHDLYEELLDQFNRQAAIDMEAIMKHPYTSELFEWNLSLEDTDCFFLRFLRARKWDVQGSFFMLLDHFEYRHANNYRKFVEEGEAGIPQIASGKAFVWGTDKEGHPCFYVRMRMHSAYEQSARQSAEYGLHIIEMARLMRTWDEQRLSSVFDFRGIGFSALDLPFAQFAIGLMQALLPETLGRCYLVDAPYILHGFWAVIRPWFDPAVVEKIVFVSRTQLRDYFDPAMLPVEFGGDSTYVYSYDSSLPAGPDSPALTEDEMTEMHKLKQDFIQVFYQYAHARAGTPEEKDTIQELSSTRQQVKESLRRLCHKRDMHHLPRNHFHRIGVLNENGCVDWNGTPHLIHD